MARPAPNHPMPQPSNETSGEDVAGFAANDNQSFAANDNDQYQPAQTRPMRNVEVDRGNAVRRAGTTTQVAGASTQVSGKTLQATGAAIKAAGKGLDVGGTAMIRTGAAMSTTGVGAIVGVPTIALGAGVKVMGLGTQAAGEGVKAAGKATNQVGKGARKAGGKIKKLGRNNNIPDKLERLNIKRRVGGGEINSLPNRLRLKAVSAIPGPAGKLAEVGTKAADVLWERRKVTRANITILSSGFSLWLGVQLPLAIMSLVFLGLAYTIAAIKATIEANVKAVVGETVANFLGTIYEYTIGAGITGLDKIFEKIFGFSLFALGDPSNWFNATYFLVVLFGWGTLLLATVVYLGFMINPFMGKGWKWKMGGFLIAAFGYLIPGLNILPWFAVYAACVWKNPE